MFFIFVVWLPVVAVLAHDISMIYQGNGTLGLSQLGYLWQVYHPASLTAFVEWVPLSLAVFVDSLLLLPAWLAASVFATICSTVHVLAKINNAKAGKVGGRWQMRIK